MCTNSEIEVKHNDYKVINLQVTYTRIDTNNAPTDIGFDGVHHILYE